MTRFLAGVLSVIAVGVLLIAYGLLGPRAVAVGAADLGLYERPAVAGDRLVLIDSTGMVRQVYGAFHPPSFTGTLPAAAAPAAQPLFISTGSAVAPQVAAVQPVQADLVAAAPRRSATRRPIDRPSRSWKKAAAVIGGTTAAGAGIGALVGGKKGALIGAAIGGGAGTVYEIADC